MALLDLFSQPAWAKRLEQRQADILHNQTVLYDMLGSIVALVSVDQSVLDAIGTELSAIGDAVQTLVDNPDVPLDAADLSVITEPISRIQNALTEPETPVEPEPEPEPGETPSE